MDEAAVDRKKLIVPALGPVYEKLAPFSYAFMRFSAGAVLVPHGVQKVMTGWADTLVAAPRSMSARH